MARTRRCRFDRPKPAEPASLEDPAVPHAGTAGTIQRGQALARAWRPRRGSQSLHQQFAASSPIAIGYRAKAFRSPDVISEGNSPYSGVKLLILTRAFGLRLNAMWWNQGGDPEYLLRSWVRW